MKRGRPFKPIPFNAILKYVEQGYNIKEAIQKTGYTNTTHCYKKMTEKQKAILFSIKVQRKGFGKYFGMDINNNEEN